MNRGQGDITIEARRGPGAVGAEVALRRVDRVESTNDEARAAIEAGEIGEATAWIAREQTASRGRLGREWRAPIGGLWLSGAWPVRPGRGITVCIGGVMGGLAGEVLEETDADGGRVRLRWPNDVMIDDSKVCGVLCETARNGAGDEWLIVGVGVNVNNDPEPLERALGRRVTSLAREAGGEMDVDALGVRVAAALDTAIREGVTHGAMQRAANLLVDLDGPARFAMGDGSVVEGILRGLSDDGRIVLEVGGRTRTLPGEASVA